MPTCPTKSQIIFKRSVVEIGCNANATGYVALYERTRITEDSPTSGFSTSTTRQASKARKGGVSVRRSAKKDPTVSKQITGRTSANWSPSFSVVPHGWRAKERTRLSEVEDVTGTSNYSSDERADTAASDFEEAYCSENLTPQSEQSSVTNISRERKPYLTRTSALSSRPRECDINRSHSFCRQLLADDTINQPTDSIADVKCCSSSELD